MKRLDILSDGPFRYVHSTQTGELLTTMIKERSRNGRETGKFIEEDEGPVAQTLREWKAVLVRRLRDDD
jgi:hypothetical protein